MNNKKPTLSQFGLTEQQVKDNIFAKNNRANIIRRNQKIDKNATAYGWIFFHLALTILLVIGISSGAGYYSILSIPIALLIAWLTSVITKSTKKQVPIYRKDIDNKYQEYLKSLEEYRHFNFLLKEYNKTPHFEHTTSVIQNNTNIISENHKNYEKPSIIYKKSKIELTISQEEIFNEMLDISLKYCANLQIEDKAQCVGICLPKQEKPRYYIFKNSNSIYVKFADSKTKILLNLENKNILLEMTTMVNEKFKNNPEKFQLNKYKNKQKQNELKKQQPEEQDNIFDTDDDMSE